MSPGIALISLRTNVFGCPWGGEQSRGWRDTGGGREREVGGAVGTKLRRPRGIYLYSSFIRDGLGESERRGSDTQQGAVLTAPQQRFRDQRRNKNPPIAPRQAGVEMRNKLGDADGVGRKRVGTSGKGKSIYQALRKGDGSQISLTGDGKKYQNITAACQNFSVS